MAGYDEEVIDVEHAAESLRCPICLGMLVEPARTPCQHWFCRECIEPALRAHSGRCPTCRQFASIWSLRRDRLVRNLVSHPAVRCRNRAMGCHWIGSHASRPAHEDACLVGQVARLQARVAELEEGMLEREKKIIELMDEVEKEAKLNLAYATENDALREQAELDGGIIESLRSSLERAPGTEASARHVADRDDIGPLAAHGMKEENSTSPLNSALDQHVDNLGLGLQIGVCIHGPEGGPMPKAADVSEDPSLTWLQAAENGDSACVAEMLQDEGFTAVNVRCGGTSETALHKAARGGHRDVVQTLLETPRFASVNALDCEDNTALHAACLTGHAGIVEMLLASKRFSGVCIQNARGHTALHCAAKHGSKEIAEMLLLSDRFHDEAVNITAEEDVLITIPYPPYTKNTTEDGWTALHIAARHGSSVVAELLLETNRFSEVNAVTLQLGYSALHIAAMYGHYEVANTLLRGAGTGFDAVNVLDAEGCSALHWAAWQGKADVAKLLLESLRFTVAEVQTTREKYTALHSAAHTGSAETARALLVATRFPTAAVNELGRQGGTALHAAAQFGNVEVADVLLKSWRFDSSNSLSKMGSTALHTAAFFGHADVAQLLLGSGRFTLSNSPTTSGMTALHVAAMQGHGQVVEAILASYRYERSAVNAITFDDGSTALHVAVQFRRLPVVNISVQHSHSDCLRLQLRCDFLRSDGSR